MLHGATKYLDGLSKASLSKHFSVDEVRWAEDAVSPTGDNSEGLGSIDLLPLSDGRCSVAGTWRLINAVTPPEKERGEGGGMTPRCCPDVSLQSNLWKTAGANVALLTL